MASKPSDPLLAAAKVVVVITQIIIVVATVGIGIGVGVLLTIGRDKTFELIGRAQAPEIAFVMLIFGFGLIMIMLQLGFRFFKQLRGIIDSVSDGEPFRSENAGRLSRMGWLAVASHGLGLVLTLLASWFLPYLIKLEGAGSKAHHNYDFGFGIGLGGILLTLILFILARVFSEGARMREELEGTV